MKLIRGQNFLVFTIGILTPLIIFTPKTNAGTFGAEIFCTMRDGGNDHESSWEAAYTYIKKQKGGIFKVSPKQAASQIIETVVREKEKYNYCVEYLDKLHPDRQLARDLKKEKKRKEKEMKEKEKQRKKLDRQLEEEDQIYSEESFNRYSY